jgi:hypothetical protein
MRQTLPGFLLVALFCGVTIASAQDPAEEEGVRGTFLVSRPAATPAKSNTGAPRRTAKTTTSRAPTKKAPHTSLATGKKSTASAVAADIEKAAAATGPIGLGYSLFMKDSNGFPVRVDPLTVFHAKDSIRISLESNIDGFLYVFYTENDNNPQMLFPDARLMAGDNRIEAHVPYEVPSSYEPDESRRWFVFDENPASEKLFIVVAREPIPGVPTRSALVDYCRKSTAGCTWKPEPAVWSLVKDALNARVKVSKTGRYGQPQTDVERVATTRGLGLDASAPAPSVVRMNVSSDAPVLVTAVELTHR